MNTSTGKGILAAALAAVALTGTAENIKLPEKPFDPGTSLVQALKDRKSTREYAARDLTPAELAGVLWAANGFNRPGMRTNATGRNKQEIEIYVCMKSGAYRYDAKDGVLVQVSDKDLRPAVADRQAFAAAAPVSVVIVSDNSDPAMYGGDPRHSMPMYDAGIVSGNIYLYCAAAKLATVCRMTMNREVLSKELKLPATKVLQLNHPVGHFAE